MQLETLAFTGLGHFDSVAVDFTAMTPGLVAVTGKNGQGKTFFLEAMLAATYREFSARKGVMTHHMKPKARLEFAFTFNGRHFRIDHKIASNTALLYIDGVSVASGLLKDFDSQMKKYFISRGLFMSTVFAAQKKEGRFEGLGKPARKSLIMELLGHGQLDRIAKAASARAKTGFEALKVLHEEITKCDLQIRMVENLQSKQAEFLSIRDEQNDLRAASLASSETHRDEEHKISILLAAAQTKAAPLSSMYQELAALRSKAAEALEKQTAAARNVDRSANAATLSARIETLVKEQEVAEAAIHGAEDQAACASNMEEQRKTADASIAAIRARMETMTAAEREKVTAAATTAERAYREADKAHAAAVAEATGLKNQIAMGDKLIATTEKDTAFLKEVPCGDQFLSCNFKVGALQSQGRLPGMKKEVGDSRADLEAADAAVYRAADVLLKAKAAWDSAKSTGVVVTGLEPLRADIAALEAGKPDLVGAASFLAKAAAGRTELARLKLETETARRALAETPEPVASEREHATLKGLVADLQAQGVKMAADVADLEIVGATIPALTRDRDAHAGAKLVALNNAQSAEAAATTAEQEAGKLQGHAEAMAKEAAAKPAKEAERIALLAQVAVWEHLALAFGPTGIQSMQIEAVGPDIENIADELLRSCYGPRFQMEFETYRKKSNSDEDKDVFEIMVTDHDPARARRAELETFSGGEEVILTEALSLAIAIFNCRKSNGRLQTLVRDETTGALDPEHAVYYMLMLRRAYVLGNFHMILYVAHNPDLWAYADVRLNVADGQVAVVK